VVSSTRDSPLRDSFLVITWPFFLFESPPPSPYLSRSGTCTPTLLRAMHVSPLIYVGFPTGIGSGLVVCMQVDKKEATHIIF
jgi:hypothetical protein